MKAAAANADNVAIVRLVIFYCVSLVVSWCFSFVPVTATARLIAKIGMGVQLLVRSRDADAVEAAAQAVESLLRGLGAAPQRMNPSVQRD